MWHVINVVQIVVVHPLNLFHLKLSQTSIILSSAQEKVLRHSFEIDLYFGKTFKCIYIYVYSSYILDWDGKLYQFNQSKHIFHNMHTRMYHTGHWIYFVSDRKCK